MIFHSRTLSRFPNLKIAFSTKQFGNLSFQHPLINKKITRKNRTKFYSSLKIPSRQVVNISLNHKNKILWVSRKKMGKGSLAQSALTSFYDGLITNEKNIYLMITTADCFPVFYFDPKKECVGLAHAGWRGILAGINRQMVAIFQKKAGSNPKDIKVFIGPGLQRCHFEVKKAVFDRFGRSFENNASFVKKNRLFVDLSQTIKIQLINEGIRPANIEKSDLCTYCENDLLSSYRRDKERYSAQGAIIGLFD